MKSLLYLAFFGAFFSFASGVRAADPAPINIHFSVIQQVTVGPITSTTNMSSSATNILSSGRSSTTNHVIDNARLLQMLANSYNTNFPTNATLKIFGLGGIAVVVGSNLILDPSAVMSLKSSNLWIFSGPQLSKQTFGPKFDSSLLGEDITFHFPASFVYDDSNLTTRDGSTTSFSANGIESFHNRSSQISSGTIAGIRSQKFNYTYTIQFTGSGVGTNSDSASLDRLVIVGDLSARISSP